jgi:hypothetical protein
VQGLEPDSAAGALLFAVLDTERNEVVSWTEFKELVTVLKVHWEREDTPHFLQSWNPEFYHSSFWQGIIKSVKNLHFDYGA